MKRNLLITACILSVIVFLYYSYSKSIKITHGFTGNYVLSKILFEDEPFSNAYDTAYFNLKTKEYGIQNVKDIPNIPTSSFLFVPVALFKPETGKTVWTILNIVFYFLSIYLLLKVFDLKFKNSDSLILIFLSFLFYPVYNNLNLGQIYIFLLLLFCLSLYGFKRENLILTALPVSLMLLLRGYGLIPLIFLMVFRKWKEAFTVILISAGLVIITLPMLGLESWKQYIINVPLKMGHDQYASYTSYQALNSIIRHIFQNQSELLYTLFILILLVIVIVIFAKNIPQSDYGKFLLYCSAASLNVIFAPIAEEYHYTLFLPLIFGIGKIIIDNYKRMKTEAIIFVISLFLLSVPFNYKALNEASFPLILLAYPRLYGGILLVLLYLRLRKNGIFNELSLSNETEAMKNPAAV